MKTEIIKNPDELQIIKNPQITNTMANKTDKALQSFKDQATTAAYILGGQAIGAQINAMVVPGLLGSQNATIQQVARAGLPLGLGVAATMFTKSEITRGLALGLGVQGVLELIKFAMPDFSPAQGFSEGSHFVFTDENGEQKTAVVTPDGQVITADGKKLMLPEPAAKKTTQHSPSAGLDVEDDALDDYYDSEYAYDDEYGAGYY